MTNKDKMQVCLNCGYSEQQVPLVAIRFNGTGNWICSQCLPTLIHKPQQLTSKLQGIENIPLRDSEH